MDMGEEPLASQALCCVRQGPGRKSAELTSEPTRQLGHFRRAGKPQEELSHGLLPALGGKDLLEQRQRENQPTWLKLQTPPRVECARAGKEYEINKHGESLENLLTSKMIKTRPSLFFMYTQMSK